MGGVFLFGYFTALAGGFLAVLGGGVGSVIDDERMQPFDLIEKMTRWIREYRNDDEPNIPLGAGFSESRSTSSEAEDILLSDQVLSQKPVAPSGTKKDSADAKKGPPTDENKLSKF